MENLQEMLGSSQKARDKMLEVVLNCQESAELAYILRQEE